MADGRRLRERAVVVCLLIATSTAAYRAESAGRDRGDQTCVLVALQAVR